jgi:hypothetical protein
MLTGALAQAEVGITIMMGVVFGGMFGLPVGYVIGVIVRAARRKSGTEPAEPIARSVVAGSSGQDARIAAAINKLETLLVDNERLEVLSVQVKCVPYCRLQRRALVAATSQRLLIFKRRVLGGYRLGDLQWQDLGDASIEENHFPIILGSNLTVTMSGGTRVLVRGLGSEMATKLYARLQQHEQAWREKNRLRAMEVMRAKAGGVTVGGNNMDAAVGEVVPPPASSPQSTGDGLEKIKQLKEMMDQGAISDTEYETLKAKIINAM